VRYDKPNGFIGRDALLRAKELGVPHKRLVHVRLDGMANAPLLYHEEPILRDGKIVGSISSGAFGHRVGASLGMGYVHCPDGVTQDFLNTGTFEVEVACERYSAGVQFQPFYDPGNERIRAEL
jgi:4-methylaminobutanoate oxidase (formaldehyde-forming)